MASSSSSTTARLVPLAPELSTLGERARRAWTERMAVLPLGGCRYQVETESGGSYLVDVAAGDCTCPDHVFRGACCKHLRRVALEITDRRVPPPNAW